MSSAKIRNNDLEIIETIAKHPTWKNTVPTVIPKTREDAE